jgi:hypothetical protein
MIIEKHYLRRSHRALGEKETVCFIWFICKLGAPTTLEVTQNVCNIVHH